MPSTKGSTNRSKPFCSSISNSSLCLLPTNDSFAEVEVNEFDRTNLEVMEQSPGSQEALSPRRSSGFAFSFYLASFLSHSAQILLKGHQYFAHQPKCQPATSPAPLPFL